MSLAQDPNELFDIVDARGNPTGIVKRRADVHRDGDWHRAIHVWIIGQDGQGPYILFQRRGLDKDTAPGKLDCTVGGHLGAGETLAEAYREIEEEVGIVADPAHLRPVGRRVAVSERPGKHIDHELQDVFFLRDERDLAAYRPNPHELESLLQVPLEPLLALLAGERDELAARQRPAGPGEVAPVTLRAGDFPVAADRYIYRVAVAARNALRGDRHVAV